MGKLSILFNRVLFLFELNYTPQIIEAIKILDYFSLIS